MGKTKRQRKRAKEDNPTGLHSVKNVQQEEAELHIGDNISKNETAIRVVLDQLQSPDVENKVFGLQTLATVFTEPAAVQEVVRHQVVRVAAPLLLDPSPSVRNIAAGALRNLSVSGGPEMCSLLVDQDVMTPLSALVLEYAGDWQPSKSTKVVDKKADTFLQAVHLLWNLCENDDTAVKYFIDRDMLSVLVRCLDVVVFGLDLVIAVAQCIQTVTEDSCARLADLQSLEPVLERFLCLEGDDPGVLLLRTLAAGLLLNVHHGRVSTLAAGVMPRMMDALAAALGPDHRQVLSGLASALLPAQPGRAATAAPTPAQEEEMERAAGRAGFLLDAQQCALELLTNLCSGDDLDDDEMDQDSSDTSDEMLSDAACEEGEPLAAEILPVSLEPEVQEGLAAHQLVHKVWQKTIQPAENVVQMLRETPEGQQILGKLCTLRSRAFLCLNNLVSSLSAEDLGGCDQLHHMWLSTCTLIVKQAEVEEPRVLEAASAALRATLQRLAELKAASYFAQLSEADLLLLFEREQKCADANVRANLIRSVGTLGAMLASAQTLAADHLLKVMGRFLLDACAKEPQLWVVAEALDTIMDVFGEDETDQAAADLGLVERLQGLLPGIRSKVRQQRRCLGDHYLLVTTVNANLRRFISYKGARLAGRAPSNCHAGGSTQVRPAAV